MMTIIKTWKLYITYFEKLFVLIVFNNIIIIIYNI